MSEQKYQLLDKHPNVVLKLRDSTLNDKSKMSKLFIDDFMGNLILPLAKQFPKWEFRGYHLRSVNHSNTGPDERFYPSRWSVHCGDEELGDISRDYYGDKRCYVISNHRIQNKRERGFADKTTKLDRAKKLILKNFRPKDLKELMDINSNGLRQSVNHNGAEASDAFDRVYRRLCHHLVDYVMDNTDTLIDIAMQDGFDRAGELQKTYEDYQIKGRLKECLRERKGGAVVLIHGDTYAVETDGGQFSTYENATLPDLLKLRVGMLKLIEDKQTLLNVGYRENEKQFYVSLEEDNGPT